MADNVTKTTDASGNASATFTPPTNGGYIISATFGGATVSFVIAVGPLTITEFGVKFYVSPDKYASRK